MLQHLEHPVFSDPSSGSGRSDDVHGQSSTMVELSEPAAVDMLFSYHQMTSSTVDAAGDNQ